MKTALITGVTGQDGSYLAENLLEIGYKVYGMLRRKSTLDFGNAGHLQGKIEFMYGDMTDGSSLINCLKTSNADEVYNLAAQSFVEVSWDQPAATAGINGLGALNMLEAVRILNRGTKFYQASTSEMFGLVQEIPQKETTPFYPRSPYGVAKLYAHWITKNYRESFGLFACSGILFNHESERRGLEFVTRKITNAAALIKYGKLDCLELGNMSAKRDWGYAADYVEAMRLMLRRDEPDDYVVASGETHEVREFVNLAFDCMGMELEWDGVGADEKAMLKSNGKTVVRVNPKFFRPAEVELLLGDPSKAENVLGWKRKVTFNELVRKMAENDERLIKQSV